MSGIIGTDDDGLPAGVLLAPWVSRRVVLVACEELLTGELGGIRVPGDAQCKDQMRRAQNSLFAVVSDSHGPALCLIVPLGVSTGCFGPVVQLHQVCVVLEPVGDLVLGGEDRPAVWKLHIRHMVIPDGIVKMQRFVAIAPEIGRDTSELQSLGLLVCRLLLAK